MFKKMINVAKVTANVVKKNWLLISILAGIVAGVIYYLDEIYATVILLKEKFEDFIEEKFDR